VACRPFPKARSRRPPPWALSYWQTQRKIVLPQALAMVVPGIMNNFIWTFMDTSLVTIVSLYELTGAHETGAELGRQLAAIQVMEGYLSSP
jgi:general L-amino acid transport system permease protein